VIAQEMAGLSTREGWLGRERVERALRRVARVASSVPMSRAGLGGDSPGKSTGWVASGGPGRRGVTRRPQGSPEPSSPLGDGPTWWDRTTAVTRRPPWRSAWI